MWDLGQSLVARFEDCAQSLPDRTAIQDGGDQWSYDRLRRAANRIAHHLLTQSGDRPEPVLVLLPQGALSVAAILGILKTGKFYVPLDPDFPEARSRTIIEDARAPFLLTDSAHRAMAEALTAGGPSVLTVDDPDLRSSDEDPGVAVNPDALAFVVYTSGSTGRPKGVPQTHRNLVHNAWRQTEIMRFSPDDRFTSLYSPSVMGNVRDLFNALLNGAALWTFDMRLNGVARLAGWLAAEKVTVLHTIASVFRYMAGTLPPLEALVALRLVILGGESVLAGDFELFRTGFPATTKLFTGLGSTETGTARQILLDARSRVGHAFVPLGYPVRDVEISLLDDHGAPVEPGEVGEIVVRSPYLAPGYWNRPDLTAASFQREPDGGVRYHTGDLGRMQPDGCLLYCGRKDFQIKVLGYRVETAEIEAAILRTGLVRESVVVGFEVRSGTTLPVAYVVSANRDEIPIERIRMEASGSLPEYMVPAAFVQLDALPRTPNGKIDREALPPPQFEGRLIRETAPRDPIERELLEIWQEVLPGKSIGIDDDFFEIGGDSLEASLMALEIERRFGVDFPLSIFIDNRTIAQLAERVRAPGEPSSSLVTIQRGGSALPLFVVPGGYGNVLFLRHLAHRLGPERPLYSLQSTRSATGLRTYYREVGEVAPAYLAEIRRAQPQGPYLLAGYSFGGYVALEMAHLLRAAGEEAALLIMLDTYPPGPRRKASALERLRLHAGNLRALGPRGWPQYLAARIRSVLLTSTRLPFIRSALRAVNYVPTEPMVASRIARLGYDPPPYPGRVIVIRARRRDPHVRWDPMDRWPNYVTGELTFLDVDGSHGTILHEPNVRQVADHIRTLLANTPPDESRDDARPSVGAPSEAAPIPSAAWREGEE